ncbi:unnamed protein product [Toxocara canis]|uniref:Secreted protein n=1 Tax=Toxocara canis TaxID=6265 RepID=A0A183UCE9_TOXCA|nr:unnamed protein product [Toxocara canis]
MLMLMLMLLSAAANVFARNGIVWAGWRAGNGGWWIVGGRWADVVDGVDGELWMEWMVNGGWRGLWAADGVDAVNGVFATQSH